MTAGMPPAANRVSTATREINYRKPPSADVTLSQRRSLVSEQPSKPLAISRTTLYLIRHGEPSEEYQGRFYGQLDIPLSERGMKQSRATAERLSGIPFDAVYSSDLRRAGHLADLLAEPLDLPVRRLEVFRERSLGVLQGLTEDEMLERFPEEYASWSANRILHPVREGENYEQLRGRVLPAIATLVEAFAGMRIALVAHGGPIRVALGHVLGMPLENVFHLVVDYGSVNVIEFPASDSPRVKLVNG
jgi:probable phosphoglycerate mutase